MRICKYQEEQMTTKQKTVYNTQKKTNSNINRKHTENRTKYITILSRTLSSQRSISGRYTYTYIYRSCLDRAAKYDIHMYEILLTELKKKNNNNRIE